MTSRREFLAALIGTAVIDPERLLWVPGKKLISIPAPAALLMDRFYDLYIRPAILQQHITCEAELLRVYNSLIQVQGDTYSILPPAVHHGHG